MRFRAALLCPGHAAGSPPSPWRKTGKLIGTRAKTVTDGQTAAKEQPRFGARRPRGIPFATDRRAGAEARHPLGSSFGLSPLSSMAVTARVRGVAVDVGICEAFAVPWTALRMDAFVPLCPLYRGAVEERYVICPKVFRGF